MAPLLKATSTETGVRDLIAMLIGTVRHATAWARRRHGGRDLPHQQEILTTTMCLTNPTFKQIVVYAPN